MTNWETCPAVERRPEKLSGAWVFQGTRVPVSALKGVSTCLDQPQDVVFGDGRGVRTASYWRR